MILIIAKPFKFSMLFFLVTLLLSGCATVDKNYSGSQAHYVDPGQKSAASGIGDIGIASHDIIEMTDKMIEGILATPKFANPVKPPRIVIDAKYFKNESTTRIDKNLITDRLRIELNRATKGKMIFVGRENLKMMLDELSLKQSGVIEEGNTEAELKVLGVDYRLGGRISTRDSVDPKTGGFSRYHQIVFALIDLNTGEIVWNDLYDFKKTARENIIYR